MPRKSWWARLPFAVRMAAGTGALLLVIGGGAAGVAALTRDHAKPRIVTAVGEAAVGEAAASDAADGDAAAGEAAADGGTAAGGTAPGQPVLAPQVAKGQIGADAAGSRTAAEADRTATRNPVRAPVTAGTATSAQAASPAEASGPAAKAPAQSAITTRTQMVTREIPYPTRLVRDPSLPRGSKQVQIPGVAGEETLRYLVTLTDGRPTGRRLLDSTVTRSPQQQVVALGDQDSGDDQGPGEGQGSWHGHRGRDAYHGRCGAALRLCVPLGRGESCPSEEDQRLEDASAVQLGGTVAVTDTGIDVLSGNGC
jgi:hypothetical protein